MGNTTQPVQNFANLLNYDNNIIFNMTPEEVTAAIISGDASRVRNIEGQFAIVEKVGQEVFMARSIGTIGLPVSLSRLSRLLLHRSRAAFSYARPSMGRGGANEMLNPGA